MTDHLTTTDVIRSNGAPPGPGRPLRFPEETLQVTSWTDAVLDNLGHDPRSSYAEVFWLPILGPSSVLLARRLADELERHPAGFELDATAWARALGIGGRGGAHSPFWRSLERCHRFGVLRRTGDHLVVRRKLPPLTAHQADRLPAELLERHRNWQAEQLSMSRRRRIAMAPSTGSVRDAELPPAA